MSENIKKKHKKHTVTDNKTGEKKCRCFKRCGGCQLDMSYAEQLEWKQAKAERMLSKFCPVSAIIGMDKPYNYRNKVQTVYGFSSGRLSSGIFQSSKKTIMFTNDCMLEDKRAEKIVGAVKKLMVSFRIKPYDLKTGQGLLKHTLIRTSANTGEIMLVLVTSSPIFPAKKNFVKAMLKECPEITSIVQNVCTNRVPLTLGERNIVMYGKGYITDEICGLKFKISPQSFYQVNPVQTQTLYNKALEMADIKSGDKVFDAYCGTGTIGMLCADKGANVVGAEINKQAYKDAIENAALNGIANINFVNADAKDFMTELTLSGEKFDVIILDPPRAGTDPEFVKSAAAMSPEKIIYISCKIETLERDLKLFKKSGYKAEFIQPVDMFPHTVGIETAVILRRTN